MLNTWLCCAQVDFCGAAGSCGGCAKPAEDSRRPTKVPWARRRWLTKGTSQYALTTGSAEWWSTPGQRARVDFAKREFRQQGGGEGIAAHPNATHAIYFRCLIG
eukprot:gene1990-biopygen4882